MERERDRKAEKARQMGRERKKEGLGRGVRKRQKKTETKTDRLRRLKERKMEAGHGLSHRNRQKEKEIETKKTSRLRVTETGRVVPVAKFFPKKTGSCPLRSGLASAPAIPNAWLNWAGPSHWERTGPRHET